MMKRSAVLVLALLAVAQPWFAGVAAQATTAVQCEQRRNLCIFDFDHTLKKGCCYHCCGVLPAEAVAAVRECIENNFEIAIASANRNYNFVRDFLGANFPSELTSKLYTEAVQTGQSYKTSSLTAVLRYHGMQSNPGCAVFFDDLWSNKKYADDVGIPFEKVDPDYGVSVTNVKDGIDKVRKGCACGVG
ncbi:N-acetyltransferase domain-containing protein [Chloropicon roscoffensis]|uniref:N-acetyltransferase domain-containing protein n=1 Tax=Chloropicon roscoffensis TaxID=1461544 RepID=A0AAX4P695_9CHLO|mmetsp:Transcript_8048/g.27649  ORF Transcript_8048/g.27649 Transcript_8048/m.27649 type:complete len:189 (+) Transcript_8048:104-670(+)